MFSGSGDGRGGKCVRHCTPGAELSSVFEFAAPRLAMPKERKPSVLLILSPWSNVSNAPAMAGEKQQHRWDSVAVSTRLCPSLSSEPAWSHMDSRIQGIEHDISLFALFCLVRQNAQSLTQTNQKQISPSVAPGTKHRLQRIRLINNGLVWASLSYTGCHSTFPHSLGR